MLNSAGERSSHSGQQRRTNYPDDIFNQQGINLPSSQPVLNYSSNQLPTKDLGQNKKYINQR